MGASVGWESLGVSRQLRIFQTISKALSDLSEMKTTTLNPSISLGYWSKAELAGLIDFSEQSKLLIFYRIAGKVCWIRVGFRGGSRSMAVSDGSSPRGWLISIHKAVSEGLAFRSMFIDASCHSPIH